jgi:hypothetical protein
MCSIQSKVPNNVAAAAGENEMRRFVELGNCNLARIRGCAWLLALSCILAASSSQAVQVDFQLTGPNSLAAAATIVALAEPMQAQDPGGASLTTTYSGTITVDVDDIMNPTSIAFISANAAAANSGNWLPEIGGGTVGDPGILGDADPGTPTPGNYGFVYSADFGAGPLSLYIASRDTVISLDTVVAGAKPITGGQFDPFGIGIGVPQGTYDANLSDPGYFGVDTVTPSNPLFDENIRRNCTDSAGTENRCTAMGSYAVAGNLVTLTVPIDFLLGGGTPLINFTGTLTATYSLAQPLFGDYNENGAVDAADYVVWRENVGTTNVLPNDALGGTIGAAHYDQWRANFGNPPGSGLGSGSAVPEPASAALALLGLVGLWFVGRRRQPSR